jgi:type I restriction enzyme S subunit
MNAERLLELYEQISEAPDAIARLRSLVLEVGVRGKLNDQNVEESVALDFLVEPRNPELPPNWRTLNFEKFCNIEGGNQPPKSKFVDQPREGYVRLFQIRDLGERPVPVYIPVSSTKRFCIEGEILIGRYGASVGKIFWAQNGAYNVALAKFIYPTSAFIPSFAFQLLKSSFFQAALEGATRTAQAGFNKGDLSHIAFPLPPLAEQHRIVAKVDELMALCDRLGEARKTREETRDKLTAATLARLTAPEATAASETDGTNAPSDAAPNQAEPDNAGTGSLSGTATAQPSDFPTHARFAIETLPALTSRPDQIKSLRQSILNLAVRGKLVEQDAADEPVAGLVKKIATEWTEQVAERKIRGAKRPKKPSEASEGYCLPKSWELRALGELAIVTDPNPSHRYPDYSGGTVPILSTREFSGADNWNPGSAKLTTEEFWKFQKKICAFEERDIIFARKGRLGLPRFLPKIDRFTFSHTLFLVKPMTGVDPHFLLLSLRRDEVVTWLTNEMNQNTGVPTLGKAKTERLPIPLPPLAEQHRIVAKVDTLMALCDRLEAALTAADTIRTRLLEALLHEALEPAEKTLEAAE